MNNKFNKASEVFPLARGEELEKVHSANSRQLSNIDRRLTTLETQSGVSDEALQLIEKNASDIKANALNIQNLQATDGVISGQISMLESEIDSNLGKIQTLEDTTTQHTSQIQTLDRSVTQNTYEITVLNATDDDHNQQISSLKATTATHTTEIGHLQVATSSFGNEIVALKNADITQTNEISTIKATQQTHAGDISDLKTAVDQHSADIVELQQIGGGGVDAETLAKITTLEAQAEELSERIEVLEDENEYRQKKYITCGDIQNLVADALLNEPFLYHGGESEQYPECDTGSTAHPHIFARINPSHCAQFKGEIIAYFDTLANQERINLALYDNNKLIFSGYATTTGNLQAGEAVIDVSNNSVTVPFDITTDKMFHDFWLKINWGALSSTTLLRTQITSSVGANFMCLNHSDHITFHPSFAPNDSLYLVATVNNGPNAKYYVQTKFGQANMGSYTTTSIPKTETQGGYSYTRKRYVARVAILYDGTSYNSRAAYDYLFLNNYDSLFHRLTYTGYSGPTKEIAENVYAFDFSYTDEFIDPTITDQTERRNTGFAYIVTTFDHKLEIIGYNETAGVRPVTIQGKTLPEEFVYGVGVIAVDFRQQDKMGKNGYIIIHKSGEMIFLPEKTASYAIRLGKGHRPIATTKYTGTRGEANYEVSEIVLYYQNMKKTHIIRRVLKRNFETNRFELEPYAKVLPNYDYVMEIRDTVFLYREKDGGTYTYKSPNNFDDVEVVE